MAWPYAPASGQGYLEPAGYSHCEFAKIQELYPSGQKGPADDQLH